LSVRFTDSGSNAVIIYFEEVDSTQETAKKRREKALRRVRSLLQIIRLRERDGLNDIGSHRQVEPGFH
jgi:hypothetical protein